MKTRLESPPAPGKSVTVFAMMGMGSTDRCNEGPEAQPIRQ
jgi:hypothetical protein